MDVTSPFWRYRIRFCKRGTARFISHRDLMGVFARAFRRADLPVRMSQGFNPRPRFSLPAPLALGIEGLNEVLELQLTQALQPDELAKRLNGQLPAGIEVLRIGRPEDQAKARVHSVRYRVLGDLPPGAVERCTQAAELRMTRPDGRELDIRPYLRRVTACDGGCDCEVLVTDKGSARPVEIKAALCGDDPDLPQRLSLVRTAVDLESPASA